MYYLLSSLKNDTKNETTEMSPPIKVSFDASHFSGILHRCENWAMEKSNQEHHKDMQCHFIEGNNEAQRAGATCPRSPGSRSTPGTAAALEPQLGYDKGCRSSQGRVRKRNPQNPDTVQPSLFSELLTSATHTGATFSWGTFFRILYVNGEHQLYETH